MDFVSARKSDQGETWAVFLRLIPLKDISLSEGENLLQIGENGKIVGRI